MTMLKGYVPNWMYVTYTIFWYEMSFLRYIRLLTCQHRWVNLVFTLMSTPVTRKKHTTKQNISLVRQEDIKMYVTCTIWMYVCMLPTRQFQKTYLPTHQFQGQNIGQKVITPKFTQTTKMMSDLNFWLFPLFKDTLLFQIGPLVQKIWSFEVGCSLIFSKFL